MRFCGGVGRSLQRNGLDFNSSEQSRVFMLIVDHYARFLPLEKGRKMTVCNVVLSKFCSPGVSTIFGGGLILLLFLFNPLH